MSAIDLLRLRIDNWQIGDGEIKIPLQQCKEILSTIDGYINLVKELEEKK